MKRCHKCGKEWIADKRQPGPKDFCDGCTAYLHCCLNCRFYDEHAHNKCRIPGTEWVSDRAGLNFCDEFEFADTGAAGRSDAKKQKALDALGSLFGDTEDPASKEGKDAFNKLFGE